MDVDVDSDPVDQNLLQQFSCLGTTDKDELVIQMQKLAGNNMNPTTAAFFLDMNNWNLQAAVCSFFDFENPHKLPSMMLVRDEISEENPNYPPGSRFRKIWQVQNSGEDNWPIGCCLQFAGGDRMCTMERIPAPTLAAHAIAQIAAEIVVPSSPGVYQSKWRMVTPSGSYFGDTIWMILTVTEESSTSELTQQLSHLNALGTPVPQFNDPNKFSNPFGVPVATSNHLHFQDSSGSSSDYMRQAALGQQDNSEKKMC